MDWTSAILSKVDSTGSEAKSTISSVLSPEEQKTPTLSSGKHSQGSAENTIQPERKERKSKWNRDEYDEEGNVRKQDKFVKLQNKVDREIREQWKTEQNELRKRLIERDKFDWQVENPKKKGYLKYVAGLDISYNKYNSKQGVAALVICEYPSMRVLYEDLHPEIADVPYVPGFLAFREVPAYLTLFERLKASRPDLWPQVLLVDGNGIMHNRAFGCACHIGVLTDIPSIGCGKTVFAQDGITQEGVKNLCDKYLSRQGDQIELIGKSGKTWGAAIKSSTRKYDDPIIISQGHKISLKTAIKITKDCLEKKRIPEPIHLADEKSRKVIKQLYYKDRPKQAHKEDSSDDEENGKMEFERIESDEEDEEAPKKGAVADDGWEQVTK